VSLEVISVLEEKIDALIDTLQKLRKSNEELKNEMQSRDQTIQGLEEEKQRLTEAVDSLKGDSHDSQKKLDAAAEKIRGIIAKLESVA
jgi:FtsZ-binding cell division protein ZapB